jgi:peptide-methionine (S)-S-oxide reductase
MNSLISIILITFLNFYNMNYKTATFGSGCFWCTEAIFEIVEGVKTVKSGYSGGNYTNPTYKLVTSGITNHAEVVQIEYDPNIISYIELLEIFWKTHDPTTINRQGNDVGTQYRSIILYHNEEQKNLANKYKLRLDESGAYDKPLVTQIEKFDKFFLAEEYHQDYYSLNSNEPYCSFVIKPKLEKFKKVFNSKLKKL